MSLDCKCLVDQMKRIRLPLRRPASLHRPKPLAMTGPALPSRMPKKPKPNSNVEKLFDQSTGQKREHHPYLQYIEVMRWKTCPESILEPAQIEHEIYTYMKRFMQQSRLMKAPGHKQLDTDVGLWKLHRADYYNSRTSKWI